MRFYTNCQSFGNKILYREIENGIRTLRSIDYSPSIFIPSNTPSKYKTLDGRFVQKLQPGSVKEAKDFIERYKGIDNFSIYGNLNFQYCYISDEFPEEINYDFSELVIAYIDIETAKENGFGTVENPTEEIIAITIKINDTFYSFGCGDFVAPENKKIVYVKCRDERDLLERFIILWQKLRPDIVSGWNTQFFDIPYITNRITRIFGEKISKKLSPWNFLTTRQSNYKGKLHQVVDWIGISSLDYIELYRKFQPKQESEKLNYVAHVELGETKISYAEYGDLHTLYKKNFQKFMEYNIHDVHLVAELERKLQLISMVVATAYDAKVNYTDVFTQVRMWDSIVFNYLRKKNIVLPPKIDNDKEQKYPGAFVKEPKPGMYHWMVSFDLDSLYPHLIAQYNISPECLLPDEWKHVVDVVDDNKVICDNLLEQKYDLSYLKDKNITMAGNGHHFRKDIHGFFPEILMRMYDDRVKYKNKHKELKKQLVSVETEIKKQENLSNKELKELHQRLQFDVAKYNNYQLAKKVQLNSAYGAMGNEYFRFFDVRLAEAITISGQVVIQWIAKDVNSYLNKLLKTDNVDYVLAIDTDSLYITLGELVNSVYKDKKKTPEKIVDFLDKVSEEKIKGVINQSVERLGKYFNVYAQKMKMKRETIAEKGIWTTKKRYILQAWDIEGARYSEPEYKIAGLEAVRSSTPEIARKAIKQAIRVIMEKDENALIQFVDQFREEFKNAGLEEIAAPIQCNNLDQYSSPGTIYVKGCPQHVKGALIFNYMLKELDLKKKYQEIKDGDKVRVLVLKKPNMAQADAISFIDTLPKEFNLNSRIDLDSQFEKTFLKPLNGILEAIGWNYKHEATLEDLLGW